MPDRPVKAPAIPPHPGLEIERDEVVWAGRFPLQRVQFSYQRFDGSRSPTLTWEMWRRGGAVCVLPYDPVRDAVALIEQFRLPAHAAGLSAVQIEMVAGLLEPGEAPDAAALRETLEETGLTAHILEPIGRYLLMPGGCDELMHYFCARVALPMGLAMGLAGTHGLAAEGEDIRLRVVLAADAFAMLDDGRCESGVLAVCLLWLRLHRDRLRAAWG